MSRRRTFYAYVTPTDIGYWRGGSRHGKPARAQGAGARQVVETERVTVAAAAAAAAAAAGRAGREQGGRAQAKRSTDANTAHLLPIWD
jgi:hypothetical protein